MKKTEKKLSRKTQTWEYAQNERREESQRVKLISERKLANKSTVLCNFLFLKSVL